jgi:hypothetical protein
VHHASPPACRADAVQWYVFARPGPHGLLITMGLYTDTPCRLPTRPNVQVFIRGRRAAVRQTGLQLSSEDVPRRTIRPKEPATAVVRWKNWCGPRGAVVLRLTLGGVTIREQLGSTTTDGPPCVSPGAPSTLAVSKFVRR